MLKMVFFYIMHCSCVKEILFIKISYILQCQKHFYDPWNTFDDSS